MEETNDRTSQIVSEVVTEILKAMRYGDKDDPIKKRGIIADDLTVEVLKYPLYT